MQIYPIWLIPTLISAVGAAAATNEPTRVIPRFLLLVLVGAQAPVRITGVKVMMLISLGALVAQQAVPVLTGMVALVVLVGKGGMLGVPPYTTAALETLAALEAAGFMGMVPEDWMAVNPV